MIKTLIEAGHYYAIKGLTKYSRIGKKICDNIKTENDITMLFIDDVHGLQDMFPEEREAEHVMWETFPDSSLTVGHRSMTEGMKQDFDDWQNFPYEKEHEKGFTSVIKESELVKETELVLSRLGKVKTSKGGKYFSGIKLFHENNFPTCVMLDVCLTLKKKEVYGCNRVINILPEFYLPQQEKTRRVISKILPEIKLEIILFESEDKYRYL
jgi:hypothetical protein